MSDPTDYDAIHEECGHRWLGHGVAGRSQGCYAKGCACRDARPPSIPDDPAPPEEPR